MTTRQTFRWRRAQKLAFKVGAFKRKSESGGRQGSILPVQQPEHQNRQAVAADHKQATRREESGPPARSLAAWFDSPAEALASESERSDFTFASLSLSNFLANGPWKAHCGFAGGSGKKAFSEQSGIPLPGLASMTADCSPAANGTISARHASTLPSARASEDPSHQPNARLFTEVRLAKAVRLQAGQTAKP